MIYLLANNHRGREDERNGTGVGQGLRTIERLSPSETRLAGETGAG